MAEDAVIVSTERGLYCPAGDFYIDAWGAVPRNVVTHSHSDHARRGAGRYLTVSENVALLNKRLGAEIVVDAVGYGEEVRMGEVTVSLHPAGHIRGSSQVRVEHRGRVWVFTGDYKRQGDATCAGFELVRCHTLITECTFGLPLFRWGEPAGVFASINAWWRGNVAEGRTSVLLAYSLGKAQRVISGLDESIGPILLHGAVQEMTEIYRAGGVELPETMHASVEHAKLHRGKGMAIAPPGALNSPWARKFEPMSVGVASGWMQVRGFRRRQAADRGFVLSDHVDWPALMQTIEESGAEHVIATHGYTAALARYLREKGLRAEEFKTRFKGEGDDEEVPAAVVGDAAAGAGDAGMLEGGG